MEQRKWCTIFELIGCTPIRSWPLSVSIPAQVQPYSGIGLPAKAAASETADAEPISIKHDASLLQAIEVASNFVGESLPVINRDTGHLLGVVTEADLFSLYLGLQNRVADLERS